MNKYELITKLHSNKTLTTLEAAFVKSKINDFIDAEGVMLYCVKKYKLSYSELLEEFKYDEEFLVKAVISNPEIYEQLKNSDLNTFKKVSRMLTMAEKNAIKQSLELKSQEKTK